MTKLRWDKAHEYQQDPGAVVDVSAATPPERWTSPQQRERKKAERAERDRQLCERSEEHDRELLAAGLERQIRASRASGEALSPLEMLFLKRRESGN
jgi:hypothetical protein